MHEIKKYIIECNNNHQPILKYNNYAQNWQYDEYYYIKHVYYFINNKRIIKRPCLDKMDFVIYGNPYNEYYIYTANISACIFKLKTALSIPINRNWIATNF